MGIVVGHDIAQKFHHQRRYMRLLLLTSFVYPVILLAASLAHAQLPNLANAGELISSLRSVVWALAEEVAPAACVSIT